MQERYNHSEIEAKWQARWEESGIYQPDMNKAKEPFYNLMMFPYPSAEGLHIGNVYAFVGSDVYGRFQRLRGKDVFEPIGFDAFGIHSENFAIKIGQHPRELLARNVKHFRDDQLKKIGNMFAWDHEVNTTLPEYYRWTQWIFLELYKAGLAERKEAPVNWCPSCKTVLADEQVEGGVCERCKSVVEKKLLKQWFFTITRYAQKLLDNLESLDWSEKTKTAQRNWIGRSEGITIEYSIKDLDQKLSVFTTRPDTNFGATFLVLAPDGGFVRDHLDLFPHKKHVAAYVEKVRRRKEMDRVAEGQQKTGVFTGLYAINNLDGRELPIYVGDFVLGTVGTGAVVGVPGHDLRDFEFAKALDLPILRVVVGPDGDLAPITRGEQVQEAAGTMINSEFLDGLEIQEAKKVIMDHLEEKNWGKRTVHFRLRDWLISRQRYWGPPIPIIYCDTCGTVPVPEEDLPVLLPELADFEPDGSGKAPLARLDSFVNTTCPQCGAKARRETDVTDNFLCSAWYFLRYPSADFSDRAFDAKRSKKWLPVDMYIGGNEHAVLHLMYSRFITMALKDMGHLDFEEPFTTFRAHGLLIKDGAKMSKSKGNVINPDKYLREFGADTLRMYLMFLGPYSDGGDFSDRGIYGIVRFIHRVWQLARRHQNSLVKEETEVLTRTRHQLIKKAGEDFSNLSYHTTIAKLMEYLRLLEQEKFIHPVSLEWFLLTLAPLAPHLAEELWEVIGYKQSIFVERWPQFDPDLAKEDMVEFVIQVNGKLRDRLLLPREATEKEVTDAALISAKVSKALAGKKIKKQIFVPHRLLNFVV